MPQSMLREWNYRSYYHAEVAADEETHLGPHIGIYAAFLLPIRWSTADSLTDHCFEMLRQSALCHADTSLTTFKWHPQEAKPMFNASESIHKCIDWHVLMDSAADRVVEQDEIMRLKNPLINPN